jgi:crotonobetainyl-CoA:carnitine CoA-transferase CaiB-like acyl-CoA transferase
MTAYSGVRIVDFSQGVAGPMAAMLLGDFDAEIIKVEPPGGEPGRSHPGYHAFNRNKQVLTLDLQAPADRTLAHALIAGADVAVFDYSPERMRAGGLEAETLTARHPALIHAWMPPYGVTGRWSELPPSHSLLTALSGVAFRQGCYGDSPVHLILPLLWYGQAITAAAAIGAALLERSRSGQGQSVVVSGLHGAAEVAGPVRVLSAAPLPRGQPLGATPSYRLYRCADGGWFFLGTLFANFYYRAFEALGLVDRWEELAGDLMAARLTLTELFLSEPRDHWIQLLQGHGVPCAPVSDRDSWFAGEAVAEGGLRREFDHPTLGIVAIPDVPARLSDTPAVIRGLAQSIASAPAWSSRATAGDGVRGQGPLAGVRVLDLGTVIAGAHAGGILANLGAEVIKIEPVEGDPFRSDGGGFLAYNRGKRGLGLDLKQDAARELFYELARSADVVFDNYRRGVRARLGIDYATLAAINPRIISASINAYGDKGPRADRPGFDPLLQAEGGMMAAQGGAPEPVLHTIPVNDVATAAMVAASIVAALNARERTGRGQEILTSLMAQSLTFQLGEVVSYPGRPAHPVGDLDCLGLSALHRFYECADGAWLALHVETEAQAAAVAQALDVATPADPLSATRDGDFAAAIAEAVRPRDRDAIVDALLAGGVPVAPCLRGPEAFDSEWLWQNDFFERWEHPRLGEVLGTRSYADLAGSPPPFRRATPDLGEHSRAVLADFGIAPERIEALLASGAIFEPGTRAATAKSARVGDGGVALATQ